MRESSVAVHGRTDCEMMEAYGACFLTDFRHHSLLISDTWNSLAWQSIGYLHAANDEEYRKTWGPKYQLSLQIFVDAVPQLVIPGETTHQFDCRTINGSTEHLAFQRIDMLLASLQWVSAWKCRNMAGSEVEIEYHVILSDDQNLAKTLVEKTDRHLIVQDSFISYLVAFDRKPEISTNATTVTLSWKERIAPQKDFSVSLGFRSGWGEPDVDKTRSSSMNYNKCTKLSTPDLVKTREVEFHVASAMLGLPKVQLEWDDLAKLAEVKQRYLNKSMPRLTGFPASWEGLFDYTLDLLRVGTKAPQGQCKDIWMAADPMFYLWTFYWDTAATAHSYCHLDADAAARTLLTFLRGGIQDDGHTWLQFNPVARYPNDRPQLMNIPMALWDCYQVSRNQEQLAEAYPLLEKHQDWIDRVWNKRPNGPIADLDWNIDYGCALHDERHLWVDMTAFQVDQYEHLAKIAELLNKDTVTIEKWRRKAFQLRDAINQYMWNAEDGAYYCLKSSNLEQAKVSCPIEFYTLTTGIASQAQARKLIKRLFDPAKYAPGGKGRYFCPSVSFDDPSFNIVVDGSGGWGGNIWLIEPYYTVRGLTRYGLQQEAFAVATNLYQMAADEFVRTGSLWEQYNPATGQGIHLKYFTSGIGSSVVDMLLRGVFGFERTDDPTAFYLTPTPVTDDWQGICNLALSGATRLDIWMKRSGMDTACRVHIAGQSPDYQFVEIQWMDLQTGAKEIVKRMKLDAQSEAEVLLTKTTGGRCLWKLVQ
jgi:hypothetical protein